MSPGRLLAVLAVVVTVGWSVTTPGGIGRWFDEMVERGRDLVAETTEDPTIRQAEQALNGRYERDGSYPVVTESLLRSDPDLSWGVGVTVKWCQARAVVLTGLTGRGTVSRLLLDGRTVGEVSGSMPCPLDLADPAPWPAP